jgi:uncharacterized protein YceK
MQRRQMTTLIHLKNMIYELMKMSIRMSYLVVVVVVMMMLESIRKHKKESTQSNTYGCGSVVSHMNPKNSKWLQGAYLNVQFCLHLQRRGSLFCVVRSCIMKLNANV